MSGENRGIRMARGELPRATDQVSTLLAAAMGYRHANSHTNAQTYRGWAAEYLLGYMKSMTLDLSVLHLDENAGRVGDALNEYNEWRNDKATGRAWLNRVNSIEDLALTSVLVPLDGAEALRHGESGSIVSIAAGPAGTFVGNHFESNFGEEHIDRPGVRPEQHYFVVVVGPLALSGPMRSGLNQWDNPTGLVLDNDEMGVEQFCFESELISAITEQIRREQRLPIVSMVWSRTIPDYWSRSRDERVATRQLSGSSLASMLAALTDKTDLSVCVARKAQVIQASVAARAIGGRLYAVPFINQDFVIPKGAIMRREGDFVTGEHALLCCTSVSEVCIVDRVRQLRAQYVVSSSSHRVSTDSFSISLATGGYMRRKHEFDLARTTFRQRDGTQINAQDLLKEFENELDHLNSP